MQTHPTVNRFRSKRGKLLRRQIEALIAHFGRPITVLDVGGRPDYWANVDVEGVERIEMINNAPEQLQRSARDDISPELFEYKVGDACDLAGYGDQSIDLVHSNSVIEHVGTWRNMAAMASEARRVGRSGWIQTPAWGFPVEPHFRAPFIHWFARPLQARLMWLSASPDYRKADLSTRRWHAERINLLSKREFLALFPECDVYSERIILTKSYVARWMPADQALP
jgi:hypothetical protein